MITLRQLEYLTALEKTKHFGKAAEMCHVTQPALSSQLQLLEERLGVLLLERRKKNVLFTEKGKEVLSIAQNMLTGHDTIVNICKHGEHPLSGPLVMGIIPTIAPYLLPKITPALAKTFPKMKLYLKEEQTETILNQLNSGELDVGLLALPIKDDRFVEKSLFEEDFVVALPKNHHLCEMEYLTPQDLDQKELLLLEEGHCLRDQAIKICKMQEYSPYGTNFRATSLETLKQMVVAGLGITLLPKMAVRKNEGYITRPFKTPAPKREIGIIWRRSDTRGKDLQKLSQNIGK